MLRAPAYDSIVLLPGVPPPGNTSVGFRAEYNIQSKWRLLSLNIYYGLLNPWAYKNKVRAFRRMRQHAVCNGEMVTE